MTSEVIKGVRLSKKLLFDSEDDNDNSLGLKQCQENNYGIIVNNGGMSHSSFSDF